MRQEVIFQIPSLYRDDFRVQGLIFGAGRKSLCVVGNTRGNEYQQVYVCAKLVGKLKQLEAQGKIRPGHEIMVVPSVNPSSMNIEKRFWPTDNTDINRMFPGYRLGETTQRVAAGVFEVISKYRFGIQMTSYYMPGEFIPHIRLMKTGLESVEKAREFGLPYVFVRSPRPFDTTTLNYNWQIWETDAFSLYTTATERVDEASAYKAVESMLYFMSREGMVDYQGYYGVNSRLVEDGEMLSIRPKTAGFFRSLVHVGERVGKGQPLAQILDAYDGSVKEELTAPREGAIFFLHNHPMTYPYTAVIKLIPEK